MYSHTFSRELGNVWRNDKQFSLSEYHARLHFILRPINQSENCPPPPPH